MTRPWLDVVGVGEAGMAGLSPEARRAVETAEAIIGGDRHPHLSPRVSARRIAWPSPYSAMIRAIRAERGRRLVLLVTGDPLWYSVGARLLRAIPGEEIRFHPQISAFQYAAARMRWSLADVETLTVHRRPAEAAIRYFAPGARLLLLAEGAATPGAIANLLTANGYGPSRLTVLGALGGPDETRIDGRAEDWAARSPDFLTLAVECRASNSAVLAPGLAPESALAALDPAPEAARAAALAWLWPRRGARLWALGAGAGAVAIDWMRAARDAEASAAGPDDLPRIAAALGAPRLRPIAPGDDLAALPRPQSVFLGDPDMATLEICLAALPPHGRLLAEGRDAPSEARLLAHRRRWGGEMTRLSAQRLNADAGWADAPAIIHWRLLR